MSVLSVVELTPLADERRFGAYDALRRSMTRSGTLLAVLGAMLFTPIASQAQTPAAQAATAQGALSAVGVWESIDDTTHEPRALIQIYPESDGSLSGKILRVLGPDANPDKRCTACTDERKGQLIQGLQIINGMQAHGNQWEDGRILDPESGKLYRSKMYVTDAGRKLVVRGYIGVSLLGRSQTWLRAKD